MDGLYGQQVSILYSTNNSHETPTPQETYIGLIVTPGQVHPNGTTIVPPVSKKPTM